MSRSTSREVRVGLVLLLAMVGFLVMVSLAGGGPGFLAQRRLIDVTFRDGQGIRAGAPVRVAGIDSGRVQSVDLVESEGVLRARVRLSVPQNLGGRLRQDASITVQASLTGSPCVNIISTGRSEVALVPGQLVQGVESSFFDPVLEQVGLGPAERSHLSHTIAEVRKTVDVLGPKSREILSEFQDMAAKLRETSDTVRPSLEAAAGHLESVAKKVEDAGIAETLASAGALMDETKAVLAENRLSLQGVLANSRDLSGQLKELTTSNAPKVVSLLTGLDGTRDRADAVLDSALLLSTQTGEILTKNRANIERTMANVKDTSDFGVRLVQKLYGNPFYLSPFYKPTKEDVMAQEFYDAASTFMMGAKELNDSLTQLQAIRTAKSLQQMTPDELKYYNQLFQKTWTLQTQLEQTNQQLVQGLKASSRR